MGQKENWPRTLTIRDELNSEHLPPFQGLSLRDLRLSRRNEGEAAFLFYGRSLCRSSARSLCRRLTLLLLPRVYILFSGTTDGDITRARLAGLVFSAI